MTDALGVERMDGSVTPILAGAAVGGGREGVVGLARRRWEPLLHPGAPQGSRADLSLGGMVAAEVQPDGEERAVFHGNREQVRDTRRLCVRPAIPQPGLDVNDAVVLGGLQGGAVPGTQGRKPLQDLPSRLLRS